MSATITITRAHFHSTRRRRWAAFLRGVGSVLDIGGTSGPAYRHFATDREAFEADARALSADWHQVGHDIASAMGQFAQENPRGQEPR